MCTIHLFPAKYHKEHSRQILTDYDANSDGTSLVVIHCGEIVLRLQSLTLKPILKTISAYAAELPECVFAVHLRMASMHSRQCQPINGCHWFSTPSGDWTYCHNGHIRQGERYRVDSLILDNFLDNVRPFELDDIPFHFANIIAIHHSGVVAVHRSIAGSLYTSKDGKRYSSRSMSGCSEPVETGWHYPLEDGGNIHDVQDGFEYFFKGEDNE